MDWNSKDGRKKEEQWGRDERDEKEYPEDELQKLSYEGLKLRYVSWENKFP